MSLEKNSAVSASLSLSGDLPSALSAKEDIRNRTEDRKLSVFLDYDGTLTPIVERPELAVLSDEMRKTLKDLSSLCLVGILSGRGLEDVKNLVNLDNLLYSGSHGFEIAPYGHRQFIQDKGEKFLPTLDLAEIALKRALKDIQGAVVERKKYSIAVHFRQVADREIPKVEEHVDAVMAQQNLLHKSVGKKVFDLKPAVDWNKGKALGWILEKLGLDRPDILPIYIGDDTTDEDAFREMARMGGIGILVRDPLSRPTHARFALDSTDDVQLFLEFLIAASRKKLAG
ncbi:MAG: trehalose-phosphatase [Proteobacteria bacterium]|nr:trehalose-phosphatase [Pseudomonadota bacterium]MBU4470640.1 trehalose-phosphatase [Pseudomonadota bacterium]MCG2753365.1 trehalose-phosphatase [Desulfobacteraceae bacterium]